MRCTSARASVPSAAETLIVGDKLTVTADAIEKEIMKRNRTNFED
jgi:hypothetical protein